MSGRIYIKGNYFTCDICGSRDMLSTMETNFNGLYCIKCESKHGTLNLNWENYEFTVADLKYLDNCQINGKKIKNIHSVFSPFINLDKNYNSKLLEKKRRLLKKKLFL